MQEITVRKIELSEKAVVKEIANIHIETFEGFFLTFMGKGFLNTMYRAYCKHEHSTLLGAFDKDGKIQGFLAYSTDMSGLYKFMIKRSLIPFAWYSFCAFLRKPKVFMRLARAFLKPSEAKRQEKYIELSSIGVSPSAKSKGIGTKLIEHLKQTEKSSGCEYICLETDAENNEGANAFYLKNGFKLVREYSTKEDRKMNEYRYFWEQAE